MESVQHGAEPAQVGMQVSDKNGLGQVAVGASWPATLRIAAVKGRAAACKIALFGRSAFASGMPSLGMPRRPGPVRLDPLSPNGGRTLAIQHRRVPGISLFLSRGEQAGCAGYRSLLRPLM